MKNTPLTIKNQNAWLVTRTKDCMLLLKVNTTDLTKQMQHCNFKG